MKTLRTLMLIFSAIGVLMGLFIVLSNPSTESVLAYVATLLIVGVVWGVFTLFGWINEARDRHRERQNERRR